MFDKAKEVLKIINNSDQGAEARIVGGAVRNFLLLQKEATEKDKNSSIHISDIDIATNLTPEQVTQVFESKKVRVIPTGIDFGTVTIVYELKNYEITTLRNDVATDGRHAKISYTNNWLEDASRRDFTFNALYMDIKGKVYDYFNGEEDLKKGIVRFIGKPEDRIKEDYLRILRMFRFHAYFGKGDLLNDQLRAVTDLIDGLDIISGERIRTEMLKLLSSPSSEATYYSLEKMVETGILQKISSIDKSDLRIGKLQAIYELESKLDIRPNPIVALATILCSKIPEEKIDTFGEKWRLSNKELRFLHRLRESMETDYTDSYQIRKSMRINGKDEFYDYIILNFAKGRIKKAEAEKLIKFSREFAIPDFPIRSDDIIKLGVQPGKKLGELLRQSEEIWERSGYILSKDEIIGKLKIA